MKLIQSAAIAVVFVSFVIAACSDSFVGHEVDLAADNVLAKKPAGTPGAAGLQLAPGDASIVYTFPDATMRPEGIAFDRRGNMYVSNRTGPDNNWTDNLVEKIAPDGSHSVLAQLGPSGDCPLGWGVLGLTTDPAGNVYAAFSSCGPNHGVVKISRDGSVHHLAGSESMLFPNSVTLDSQGNLYATDSFGGAVYRYGKSKSFELWVAHDFLAPDLESPIPWGANGIAYKAPDDIYVANTTGGWIVHIPVLSNGDAGIPEKIMPTGPMFWMFLAPDGIAIDVHGMLYSAMPAAGTPPPPGLEPPPGGFPPMSPVVKMDPSTGMVTPVAAPFLPDSPEGVLFDTATSLAFGSGPYDRRSLFVISGDIFLTPWGSGPVVTQVGVGVPGSIMGQ